jgi:hypothetical protein
LFSGSKISAANQGLDIGSNPYGGQAAAQLGGYGSFPEAKKVASAYTPERSIGSMIY